MNTDLYTKVVLGVVAVCLALLVVQGFGVTPWRTCPVTSAAMGDPAQPAIQERFRIFPVAWGRVAFRMDTLTGATWRMAFPGGTEWTPVREGSETTAEVEQDEDVRALAPKAPARPQRPPAPLQKPPVPPQKTPAAPEGPGS